MVEGPCDGEMMVLVMVCIDLGLSLRVRIAVERDLMLSKNKFYHSARKCAFVFFT